MYDYFRGLWQNREKALTVIFIGAFLLVAVCWFSYCIGLRNAGTGIGTGGENLHDNGNAAAGIRNEIDAAGSNIVAAESGIDNAADTAGRIENRIEAAQGRVEYIKTTAAEGQRIIKECQSILREVRARGKEKAPKD